MKESGRQSLSGLEDHRQTGKGAGCVSMCVPGWGVVDMFTMGNEPISCPGGMWGCLRKRNGGYPIRSSSKMWVTSHPRVILLVFLQKQ